MAKMPVGMRRYTFFINHDFSAVALELKSAALVHTNTHAHILRAVWLLAQREALQANFLRAPYGEDYAAARPPHDRPTTAPRPPHDRLTTASRPPHDRLWETKRFVEFV